ncbi:MAG: hypothetical protein IAE67_02085 [Candidatus Competibacteraceae bacterium]|nr:hypothetical protein [Candidatus Competibacteraceae bacterium]
MEYYIFHHTPPLVRVHSQARQIWFPLSSDVLAVIDYLQIYAPPPVTIMLETSFEPFLPSGHDYRLFQPHLLKPRPIQRVLFYGQSDTLAHSCRLMGDALKGEVLASYAVPLLKRENADTYFDHHHIPYHVFSYGLLKKIKPELLIVLNDWSKQPRWAISLCRAMKIPVVCMQESVIDFGDAFRRMQYADEVMLQGTQSMLDLNRATSYLTGNPRYESLLSLSSSARNYALINCNFTYGIFEDVRQPWLTDITGALSDREWDFVISQHPRDRGDLSAYKQVIPSSSSSVAEQLQGARCLITRFSSLIHEALVAGVPVIYYNPHGEKMKYRFRFNQSFLFLATNIGELEKALDKIQSFNLSDLSQKQYLINHCIQPDSLPSTNLSSLFRLSPFQPKGFSLSDALRLFFFHPILLRIIWRFKKSSSWA